MTVRISHIRRTNFLNITHNINLIFLSHLMDRNWKNITLHTYLTVRISHIKVRKN
jgi:hypothetical protein